MNEFYFRVIKNWVKDSSVSSTHASTKRR